MTTPNQLAVRAAKLTALVSAASFCLLSANAFPVGTYTFKDNAPFEGSATNAVLTSADGLLTVRGWADSAATVLTNLYQWWWIMGVNSGTGNGALLDGQESITLQFDKGVGCSHICFFYTGNQSAPATPAVITISGFLEDPKAFATTYVSPLISNIQYSAGTLTFDYLYDYGNDYGQLLFANPSASRGQVLKIRYAGTSWGAALFRVDVQEEFGGPALQPVHVKHNFTNAFTTPDAALTVKGFSNRDATIPANFGTYVDQCFGVFSGNTGALDGDESITLQFAPGFGLSRIDGVYASGMVTISGFAGDPGFTDNAGGSFGATYADGVLFFYPMDGGHHAYFFTNRAASAGQTLKITADSGGSYQFPVAGIGYAGLKTILAADIASDTVSTHTSPDGILSLSAYSDTAGSSPANLHCNVDWFGIAGGNNSEAVEGSEALKLQFSGGAGLSSLGSRYTSGRVVISGFAGDPGFVDPSGTATDVAYSSGVLSFTFNAYRSPELLVRFANVAASANRTLWVRTDGNPGAQIALTRIGYAIPDAPVEISIQRHGDKVVLTWPRGVLQQSSDVAGSFGDLTGVASPYTNTISGMRNFFRVRVP